LGFRAGPLEGMAVRVLVVGHQGYVGPVLGAHLRRVYPQAQLIGFDTGYFAQCATGAEPASPFDAQHHGDVRDIIPERLEGVDAVVALAAISNDPMGARFAGPTDSVNRGAVVRLAEMAARAGVQRFVFASSCSVYGFAPGEARKESDPLNPQTAYARSKIEAERALAALDARGMSVTCLRFATACGWSPRLRLDLVLNDFVAAALASRRIAVLSDGTPWRPLIDVADMALAVEWALSREGPPLAINVGAESWNYQVRDLAKAVARALPGVEVSINRDAQPDTRSYKVDFSLYRRLAPAHQPRLTLDASIARLVEGLSNMGFSDAEFRTSRLMRLKMLEAHCASGRLDGDLRWTEVA